MNPRTDAAKLYVRIFALLLVLGVGTQGVLAEIGPTNSDASSVAVKQLANSIFVDPVAPVTRTDGHVITVNEETVTAASTGPIDVEFISQVGGVTQSVYVQGNYAFIGEGPRLSILDVSNPSSPRVVGKTDPLSGTVEGVYAIGTYAYVLYPNGLHVVDVSDPANPFAVGYKQISVGFGNAGIGMGMLVSDNLLYIPAGYAGLRVVDVSDPTNPSEVGFYNTPGVVRAIYVEGDLAYVAASTDPSSGLYILDVSV